MQNKWRDLPPALREVYKRLVTCQPRNMKPSVDRT
jgi:hypothetical protein